MISIKFRDDTRDGRLATAEIHFQEGELAGLKLRGFAVTKQPEGLTVTFPSALRPTNPQHDRSTLGEEILDAYAEYKAATEANEPTH